MSGTRVLWYSISLKVIIGIHLAQLDSEQKLFNLFQIIGSGSLCRFPFRHLGHRVAKISGHAAKNRQAAHSEIGLTPPFFVKNIKRRMVLMCIAASSET